MIVFPDEILYLILSFIDYLQVIKLKLVCKKFKTIIDSEYFETIHPDYKTIKLCQLEMIKPYRNLQDSINCATTKYKRKYQENLLDSTIKSDNYSLFKRLKNDIDRPESNRLKMVCAQSGNLRVFKLLEKTFIGTYQMYNNDRDLFKTSTINHHWNFSDYLFPRFNKFSLYDILVYFCKIGDLQSIQYLLNKDSVYVDLNHVSSALQNNHYSIVKLLASYLPDDG